MKLISSVILVMFLIVISGCSSKSIVLRKAPEEGVQTQGINILYRTSTFVQQNATNTEKISAVTSPTHPEAERLGKDIKERMLLDFKNKGFDSNFATIDLLPGIEMTPMKDLFPSTSSKDYYTLIITPVKEQVLCYQTCSTTYTVSLSLRTPLLNKEVWNLRLVQSDISSSDIMPFKNNQFIDDMTNAVLTVVHH
ncbi:hypothetical protein [Sulfurospirillum oryzae]|uniref:hypothetical protein n=1 Tax=Sulfurospirillum oryzae TaxID=2976535 RepID=UPI0021E77057|nr:hypothetical protein [Sulfurospirillum oryzae]